MRTGGRRKDRVFKVYLTIPDGVTEDQILDYIEDAVMNFQFGHDLYATLKIDVDSVSAKRGTPQYAEQ